MFYFEQDLELLYTLTYYCKTRKIILNQIEFSLLPKYYIITYRFIVPVDKAGLSDATNAHCRLLIFLLPKKKFVNCNYRSRNIVYVKMSQFLYFSKKKRSIANHIYTYLTRIFPPRIAKRISELHSRRARAHFANDPEETKRDYCSDEWSNAVGAVFKNAMVNLRLFVCAYRKFYVTREHLTLGITLVVPNVIQSVAKKTKQLL